MTIDKIALLCIRDNRVLVARSQNSDAHYFPGGKREPGESDIQCLVREIAEELSVRIDAASARYYGTFTAQAHGKPEGVLVRMTCYLATYNGTLKPGNEIAEYAWVGYINDKVTSIVGKIIMQDLYSKKLISD